VAAESTRAVVAALLGNGALAILKGVAAAVTGSAAMLAETFHSIADTGNQVLLLLGARLSERPPDDRHPFGHGRNVYFWAFIVSIMLFTLGGAFAIWEAIRNYLHPHPHESYGWAYGVLAGAFVFEAASLAVAVHALREALGGRSVIQYWRDSRDPTLLTVLLEDSAALLSVVIAASGIAVGEATGSSHWDAAASGVIGLLLLAVAVFLAFENYSLLIGETATPDVEARIRRVLADDPAVASLRSLHTMHLGPHAVLVTVEVAFHGDLSASQVAAAVARLEDRVRVTLPDGTTRRMVSIEPTPDVASVAA
jgi:cation diffusion facilitator family transporter